MSKLLASAAAHRGGLAAAPPGREAVERNELMRALQFHPHRAGSGRVVSCRSRFTATATAYSMPHPYRRRGPKPDRRRALELLAASPEGCTEALMFANGFTAEMLLELVRAGLASAHPERMVADGKMSEVARVKISEAGWQTLADGAINGRAKLT